MTNFLDLDFPYPPLFGDKNLQNNDVNNENHLFKSKLFILPACNINDLSIVKESIKSTLFSDINTIIFLLPTCNYLHRNFMSFQPEEIAKISKNYKFNFDLFEEIVKNFNLKYEDFYFEYSEILKYYFDFLESLNNNLKFIPLFFYDLTKGTITEFLKKYYGNTIIMLLSNLSIKTKYVDAIFPDENTAFQLEDNNLQNIGYENFSAYKILPELINFNLRNKFSLIRLCLSNLPDANPTDKFSGNIGIWGLYEGTKFEYIQKYYSKTVIDYAKFNLRRDLHLICGEEFKLPEVFNERFKVMVSMEKDGFIRGVSHEDKLYESLQKSLTRQTFGAAFSDDRFAPLKPNELSCTKINITLYSDKQDDDNVIIC